MQKGESLDSRNLPESSQHDFADPIAQRIGHAQKLELIAGNYAPKIKNGFNKWAGRSVHESDIMDMMCVPRAHANSNPNHPIYMTGLKSDASDGHAGFYTTVSDNDNIGYNYFHENALKKDKTTGEPYLYFGLVNHGADGSGSKEVSVAHALYNAAMAAHRNGVKSIRLHAALGDSYVGGLAWPKLGFDANLSEVADGYRYDPKKKRQILSRIAAMKKNPVTFDVAHKAPEEYSLLDLLAHPGEYKKYFSPAKFYSGSDNAMRYPGAYNMENAVFDTNPNSRSMKILTARLRKIEAAGRKP